MLDLLLTDVRAALAVVAGLMVADYLLTLLEQRAFRRHMARFMDVDTFEQNPFLARDVSRNRWVSPRHVAGVTVVCLCLWALHRAGYRGATAYELVLGAATLTFLEVDLRHFKNWLGYLVVGTTSELSGQLKVGAGYGQRQLAIHHASLVVLWGALYLLLGRLFLVGGMLGALASAARSFVSVFLVRGKGGSRKET